MNKTETKIEILRKQIDILRFSTYQLCFHERDYPKYLKNYLLSSEFHIFTNPTQKE